MNDVRIYAPGQAGYRTLQAAVAQHYERCYAAHPRPAPHQFWCLAGRSGRAPGHACLGLSWSCSGKLFSENYLDRPIPHCGRSRCLVEIGQVSSFSGQGSGAYLMFRALRFLSLMRDGHVILTGTQKIRRLLDRLGVVVADLGPARIERLPDRSVDWGSYYEQQPRVVGIDLRTGLLAIREPEWTAPEEQVEGTRDLSLRGA